MPGALKHVTVKCNGLLSFHFAVWEVPGLFGGVLGFLVLREVVATSRPIAGNRQ